MTEKVYLYVPVARDSVNEAPYSEATPAAAVPLGQAMVTVKP